ncbi:hypothetical protein BN946_scf184915.g44 [Trametes cinnabarina]|uniref:Ras-GEF domain-containing protein n=1 Tax=Pycnoporus cinnabarinus TaxID=5643 RepID=A0A060SBG7_PYCCI|nr:hypothetical protein BN946_scf184915.g44 [Trametes cinnabarina]
MSTSSTTSWASSSSRKGKAPYSRNDHRPTAADTFGPGVNMYCPPLMLPLLRGLSLLQNAVRMNRVHHFQPATACIISCVRSLLSEIGCLSRDAPLLKQHGVLAQERKRILSDLASLVSQAKRASDEVAAEDAREIEVQAMVRLAGQLFAHVRGFLAVAVQCGVNLPQNAARVSRTDSESASASTSFDGRWDSANGTLVQDDERNEDCFRKPGRTTNSMAARPRRITNTMTPTRPKSLGDLKMSKRTAMGADYPPVPTGSRPQRKLSEQQLATPARRFVSGHRGAQDSVSSVSSSSSGFSSSDSSVAPPTPVFPSGPATSAELTEALRATHDAFLSTIAAFIGHAHSHSRSSHASSTGHMYDLVREVVDTVSLVERMTPHDSLVEPPFAAVFFMTFRLFTTPADLLDAVITRYNILPPPGLCDADLRLWQQRKGLPVRLRVSNFIKTWVESYWRHASDSAVVPTLVSFTREALSIMFPGPSQRILELIHQRMHSSENVSRAAAAAKGDRLRDAGIPLNPPVVSPGPLTEIPRPIITKAVFGALRGANFAAVAVTDFDALELARQLTVMECTLYCAIQPEELLFEGGGGNPSPARVKAVTSLSTAITGWVAESILNEPDTKRRTALVKFFIKLADRCVSLRNYSTPRSILAALDSSTIARLHQTWMGLSQKYKVQMEALRKLADHARNYHEYRSRLRNIAPPAVPFLGLYLTDLTFCREGNPSHRTSPKAPEKKLINFNKYHKLARIVQDMQRFQVPYNLKEIPEVQMYLRDAFEKSQRQGDLQDLYRRSLLVEPKQSAETPPSSDVRQLFAWASRSQQPPFTPAAAS